MIRMNEDTFFLKIAGVIYISEKKNDKLLYKMKLNYSQLNVILLKRILFHLIYKTSLFNT